MPARVLNMDTELMLHNPTTSLLFMLCCGLVPLALGSSHGLLLSSILPGIDKHTSISNYVLWYDLTWMQSHPILASVLFISHSRRKIIA